MNARGQLVASIAAVGLSLAVSTMTMAQGRGGGPPAAPATPTAPAPAQQPAPQAPAQQAQGRGNFVPEPVPPAQAFKTSTEHYAYLMRLHKGGTRHTYETVPKWEGLWSAAGNTQASLFLKGTEIIPGVLTPAYEAAFKMRRSLGADYDRLTRCEPAGYPRWLLEPYVREFVNTPTQSWWPNDLGNDTRRIYINQEHKNIDGTHSAEGDSIGFWVNDMLIVHTIHVYPGDYFRNQPPTSNQFESVEVWRMIPMANGEPRLSVNVTFYDQISLARPVTVVYTFRRNTELEDAGYRMRHWECESNQNTYLVIGKDGKPSTQFRLPGEPGYLDPRGVDPNRNPDLPKDLPGQEKNPIFEEALK